MSPDEPVYGRHRSIPNRFASPRWLRVPQAAAYLGVGVSTLNKLRIYGGGPAYAKLGATVIYSPADLDAWANERKIGSTSECVRAA